MKTITIYKLQPAFGTAAATASSPTSTCSRATTTASQFDIQKKMSNRWQMLAGLTLQQHKRLRPQRHLHQPPGACDFNNPNCLINRDDGSVFTDLPWTFKLSGSYHAAVATSRSSAKYTARAGDPLNRTVVFTFTNPTADPAERDHPRGAARRGPHRDGQPSSSTCGSASASAIGIASLELSLDMFNVMNANHVLLQNEALGATWGRPDPHPDAAHHPVRRHGPLLGAGG